MTAKQKFRMLHVFRSAQKIFKITAPADARIKGTAESAINTSNLRSLLLNLPNELLFRITSFLEDEYQLLLRICCRQLHLLLRGLDPKLCDLSTKLRFYKCLEPDYPEYLPCLVCGIMFKWRSPLMYVCCPREGQHQTMSKWTSAVYEYWYLAGTIDIRMSRLFIGSILRAHERGERYGYPVPSLRSSGLHRNGVLSQNDARMIGGELVLATRWELDADLRMEWKEQVKLLFWASCLHWRTNGWHHKISALLKGASTNTMTLKRAGLDSRDSYEDSWAAKVAKMNREGLSPNGKYGFPVPTTMGACEQTNEWTSSWEKSFSTLVSKMFNFEQEIHAGMQQMHQVIQHQVVPSLLRPLETGGREIQPTIVHGDIWNGNTSVDATTGKPVIFDASGMYAHNEYEFSALNQPRHRIYRSYIGDYQKHFPVSAPEENIEDRLILYRLRFNLYQHAP
ncbi:hypothetical protein Z517_03407 [Fonsecaea pedrosoi CBS 271.37]|uniref:protein-ribulosamine 3-kinase n=1 Tax=Fonsecaea pedrosoi CBS 271.37 TaxID=1442368 RepID=A0A0D2GT27_9EURO|nr:uncharacterized protein Z517_03407 [Fonsecaea pedrosoi CBS 271.37]KIW84158.1 hypothetical protein Z517_03407 [Fonsecaea pedrosoi CBS 271.37]